MICRFICFLIILSSGFLFYLQPIGDPDLGWHLLGGEYVLNHQAVPRSDFINAFNPEWIDYHWLGQAMLAAVYRLGDFNGLKLFLATLMLSTFVILAASVRAVLHNRSSLEVSAAIVLIAAVLMSSVISVRPQAIAVLGLTLALLLLLHRSRFELLTLFALAIVLANLHVFWLFIPLLWIIMRGCPRICNATDADSSLYVWGGAFLLLSAAFVSPYAVKNYAVILDYLNIQPSIQSTVTELRPGLEPSGAARWMLIAIIVLIARTVSLENIKRSREYFVLALVGLALVFYQIKFASVAALFLTPYLAILLADLFDHYRFERIVWVLSLCSIALIVWWGNRANDWEQDGATFVRKHYPISICTEVGRNAINSANANSRIVILTHFNDGGWCRWALDHVTKNIDFRVTSDGRTQLVPDEHYSKSFALFGVKDGWQKTLAEWKPGYVVAPKRAALANLLPFLPSWKRVAEDANFVAFIHS